VLCCGRLSRCVYSVSFASSLRRWQRQSPAKCRWRVVRNGCRRNRRNDRYCFAVISRRYLSVYADTEPACRLRSSFPAGTLSFGLHRDKVSFGQCEPSLLSVPQRAVRNPGREDHPAGGWIRVCGPRNDNAPNTGASVGIAKRFYCQNSRQSGQYPVAANATPATAESAAPISILCFILPSPLTSEISVARLAHCWPQLRDAGCHV
jgi:hypothetical protein